MSDMPPGADAPKSEQVNARLPEEMVAAIDARARREDRSRSLMIRRLLAQALAEDQPGLILGTVEFYKMGSEPIASMTISSGSMEQRQGLGEHVNWVVFKPGDPNEEETR